MERPAGRFFMLFIEFRSPSSDRPPAGMHPPKTYINYTGLETTIATWRTNHELMACIFGKTD